MPDTHKARLIAAAIERRRGLSIDYDGGQRVTGPHTPGADAVDR
ncbi:hypothetical protein [Hydrocarboniphaga sp.]|nr:hypothetical protein [Hydrocarboniphaga sp.]